MTRYVCIHGHFYQPPRENPWLEEIEIQDSAAPYHDWNERIDAECYAQNATSRILDGEGRIARITNNYARISFNIGPTVLSWMEDHAQETYAAILEGDRESKKRFGGHGSAIAQAYNHMILPLATRRDKQAQVYWGVRDFERRFGREPEGMWLPETAVDVESLEILAEHGIRFTILSPYQARRWRTAGAKRWTGAAGEHVDPSHPYRQRLPSGREIVLFFYDGPISRAVAFEELLANGETFAARLLQGFSEEREGDQLVHIATDGESYGHHHRFGDMALASALAVLEQNETLHLTNYGEYLESHPPQEEVEVQERTAWSCSHGVGRWFEDCGCSTGGSPGWNQAWRGPLRGALDWLRDELALLYEEHGSALLADPWRAREAYVDVVLDRRRRDAFLAEQRTGDPGREADVQRLCLLEMQRHAMLMFTSCGWFFDDVSRIEAMQVVEYAGRAIQLARQATGRDLSEGFVERLSQAQSNLPELGDAGRLYHRWVEPAMLDLERVGAHFAVRSLFEEDPDDTTIFCYEVHRERGERVEQGYTTLGHGRMRVSSQITLQAREMSYVAVHFGDHTLSGGVQSGPEDDAYREDVASLLSAFQHADLPRVIELLGRRFGDGVFSLRTLFRDEQRRILERILANPIVEADSLLDEMYRRYAGLIRFLADSAVPTPEAFSTAATYALNHRLRGVLKEPGELDDERLRALLAEARDHKVEIDRESIEFLFRRRIEAASETFRARPASERRLARIELLAGLLADLPLTVDLWRVQNHIWHVMRDQLPIERGRGERRAWVQRFEALAIKLGMGTTSEVP